MSFVSTWGFRIIQFYVLNREGKNTEKAKGRTKEEVRTIEN